MVTAEQVKETLDRSLHPFVAYITQIANLYIAAGIDKFQLLYACFGSAALGMDNKNSLPSFRAALIRVWELPQYQRCRGSDE